MIYYLIKRDKTTEIEYIVGVRDKSRFLRKVLDFFEEQKLLDILGDRPWCPLSPAKISGRSLVGA
jgi:hypothetical protein